MKVKPGVVFSVKMVETQRRVYESFERVTVDPGTSMEVSTAERGGSWRR